LPKPRANRARPKSAGKPRKVLTVENISSYSSLLTQVRKLPREPVGPVHLADLTHRLTALRGLPQYTDLARSFIALEQKLLHEISSQRVFCVDQLISELFTAGYHRLEQLALAVKQIATDSPTASIKKWRQALESIIDGLEELGDEEGFDSDFATKLLVYYAVPYIS